MFFYRQKKNKKLYLDLESVNKDDNNNIYYSSRKYVVSLQFEVDFLIVILFLELVKLINCDSASCSA